MEQNEQINAGVVVPKDEQHERPAPQEQPQKIQQTKAKTSQKREKVLFEDDEDITAEDEEQTKRTASPIRAAMNFDKIFAMGGTQEEIRQTPLGERQAAQMQQMAEEGQPSKAGLMEKMGLAAKKDRSTTTTRTLTGEDGVSRTISQTENDYGKSTTMSQSGKNEDGSKWKESITHREEDAAKKKKALGVGGAMGAASALGNVTADKTKQVGKVAVDLTAKATKVADQLVQ